MAQEQFAGPQYVDSFDPEKFNKQLRENHQSAQQEYRDDQQQGEAGAQS